MKGGAITALPHDGVTVLRWKPVIVLDKRQSYVDDRPHSRYLSPETLLTLILGGDFYVFSLLMAWLSKTEKNENQAKMHSSTFPKAVGTSLEGANCSVMEIALGTCQWWRQGEGALPLICLKSIVLAKMLNIQSELENGPRGEKTVISNGNDRPIMETWGTHWKEH